MCGVVGFWSPTGAVRTPAAVAATMTDRLAHRGPDDCGVWTDAAAGLALGHRRLSIIDLSPAGHQPMMSACGRFVLSYNGELYNHDDLRADLAACGAAPVWRGRSDTETLLAALVYWGVPAALTRVNGMFAFALWDCIDRVLWLARDRLGEKPLYYGRCGPSFLFGSELKALAAHPHWQGDLDRGALTQYLRFGCVPAPYSIWRGITKLPPAHIVTVRDGGASVAAPVPYWDPGVPAADVPGDPDEAVEALDALIRDAVRRRMAADVPLGAFLSGGIDSSTVTALMQAQSERPVQTFSIGFADPTYDEAPFARRVAAHLGTDHTEIDVAPAEAMAVIPALPTVWDEPFADSSQIPTYLVSRLARRRVTVALSGDGGDEVFCGYTRYTRGHQIWRAAHCLPGPLRRGLAAVLAAMPAAMVDRLTAVVWSRRSPGVPPADRLAKLAEALRDTDGDVLYHRLVSVWQTPAALVRGGGEPALRLHAAAAAQTDMRARMMLQDLMTYLPNDILTKVDRATMAVGLEARVPLLDHRLVAFARALSPAVLLRDGKGKWPLRRVLARHVPEALVDRPKMGFAVPIDAWLVGPLRGWAEELLDTRRLDREGVFEPAAVRRAWHEHVNGTRRHHHRLWAVLMFQAWYATHRTEAVPTEAVSFHA